MASTHGGFFHTPYAARLKKVFFHTVTRTSLRAYSAILASSANDRDLFAKLTGRYIVSGQKTGSIRTNSQIAQALCFASGSISIGRFASHKRLDLLLDFLVMIRARDPEWSLALLGVEWDVKIKELNEMVMARGLASAVSIRSNLSNAEIADEIRQASFVVSASDYEGFGISIIEGMSAGLLPVMSGIPPFRRLRERLGIGSVLDFANSQDAATRFINYARGCGGELSRRSSVQGARRCGTVAWPTVARKIDTIYDRVAGEHRRTIPARSSRCCDARQGSREAGCRSGRRPFDERGVSQCSQCEYCVRQQEILRRPAQKPRLQRRDRRRHCERLDLWPSVPGEFERHRFHDRVPQTDAPHLQYLPARRASAHCHAGRNKAGCEIPPAQNSRVTTTAISNRRTRRGL